VRTLSTFDFFKTVETLIPQGVLLAVLMVTFALQIRKWSRRRKEEA
jgi:hypothetical protein